MPQAFSKPLSPTEIIGKIRRIEIRTSRLVNELFGGRYHSTFKGRGVEFSDVREYVPGDDIRSIHWKITAKLGIPFIKRFTEERELTVVICVDVSGSHIFGTRSRLKSELAAELVSLLAFASFKNNDKVGLLLFSDKIEKFIPPRKSKSHALRLVREALGFVPQSDKTDIGLALEYLNRVQKKRAVVFLISDFMDSGYEKNLKITQRHHDTISFVLEDPMEHQWPKIGKMLIRDAETGAVRMTPGDELFRKNYTSQVNAQREARDTLFAKIKLDRVVFQTNEDYVKPLLSFFMQRAKRYR